MRFDLTDVERTRGIAEGLGRLFWCLVVVAFLAAILGSPGTGLLVLILGGAAFVVRVGLEDLARAQRRHEERAEARASEIAIHRSPRARADRLAVEAAGRARSGAPRRAEAEATRRPTRLGAR